MGKTSKAEKEVQDPCKIMTPEFRVSYPHVFKPSVMKGTKNDPKYSVTMLFEKDSDLDIIKGAIRAAKIKKWGKNKADWPEDIESPVVDGDGPKGLDKNKKRRDGYEGHYAIKASTGEDQRPGVVDENVDPIINVADFYPGCYARAHVFAYVWEFPKDSGNFGVGFILDHVQKLRDGKSFGGKKSADEVFTKVNSGKAKGRDEDDEDEDSDEDDEDFR